MNTELRESVMVVPRDVVDTLCPKRFCLKGDEAKASILANHVFLERTVAEHDFRFKQIIPYVLIRHGHDYLLIRRTKKQTESRLHDMYSLGIGGHINNGDFMNNNLDVITSGMRRELEEEIQLESEESCKLIGMINDDSTEVARVHMGLIYVLVATSPKFSIVEKDKYTAMWKSPTDITKYYGQMESWAQIVHDYVLFSSVYHKKYIRCQERS